MGTYLRKLNKEEKGVLILNTLGGNQKIKVVNESGLYGLTFMSRKPKAMAFRKWVTSEVLPAIRKGGGYINPNASNEQIETLKDRLNIIQERNKLLENHNKVFGNSTPYALPSETNGIPRTQPVKGYLRSTKEPVLVDNLLVQTCFDLVIV